MGGEQPKNALSWDQIDNWSKFAEANHSKGMSFDALWEKYKKANPKTDINPDALKNELNGVKQWAMENAKRHGMDPSVLEDVNTGYAFPEIVLPDGKSLGRVNGMGQTKIKPPMPGAKSRIPKDATDINVDGETAYWKNQGDVEFGPSDLIYKSRGQ